MRGLISWPHSVRMVIIMQNRAHAKNIFQVLVHLLHCSGKFEALALPQLYMAVQLSMCSCLTIPVTAYSLLLATTDGQSCSIAMGYQRPRARPF